MKKNPQANIWKDACTCNVFVLQKIESYIRYSGHPQSFWRYCERHWALELSTGWRSARNPRLFMYAFVQWKRERAGIINTQMLTKIDCSID